MPPRVVVIGGGFAGIAAACRLAAAGHRPLLLEAAPRLGGRAASTVDPTTGDAFDYGHHILMACCTAARGFLARIGASELVRFQPALDIPIRCDGTTTHLRSSWLPGPAHLAPSLLAYRPLDWADRMRALGAGLRLVVGRGGDDVGFVDWLCERGASPAAHRRLWDPISIATLNAPASAVSLAAARKVFHDAFFSPDGANIGLFTRPVGEAFDRAHAYIEQHGGEVRTRARVTEIRERTDVVAEVALADGETIACDAAVAAVPPHELKDILSTESGAALQVEAGARLDWSPIVDVHLWLDRPVIEEAFLVTVDAPIQTLFDLTKIHGEAGNGSHLVISQSAAGDWLGRSTSDIADRALDAVRELVPGSRDAVCQRHRVLIHRQATFVPAPGSEEHRPGSKTSVQGLFLAGDWTRTGWPSTIEGAIRSGIQAAARAELDLQGDDPSPGTAIGGRAVTSS